MQGLFKNIEQQSVFTPAHLRYTLFMLLNIENETRFGDKLNSSLRKCHQNLRGAPRLTIDELEMSDF